MKKLQNIVSAACLVACGAFLSSHAVLGFDPVMADPAVLDSNIKVFDYSGDTGQLRKDYDNLFVFISNNYDPRCKIMIHLNGGELIDVTDVVPAAVMVNHPKMNGTFGEFIDKLEDADKKNATAYKELELVANASMTMAVLQVESRQERKAIFDQRSQLCAVHEIHPGHFMVGGTTKALREVAEAVPNAIMKPGAMTHIHFISHQSAHNAPKVEDILREHAKAK